MNIYGLIVILLFLGQAHCEGGKITDVAKYRFSFPFANCSKPFFLIRCLSQFLKLIVRLPLNYSFFYVFKGLVSGNGNLFQHFSPLTMLDSLSKSVDVQVFCVFFFQRKSKWPLFELLEKEGPMYSQPISCEATLRCLKNYQFNLFYIQWFVVCLFQPKLIRILHLIEHFLIKFFSNILTKTEFD